nr:MAG TPA: hypothetical protein [Bacteriophage sp.]
MFIYKGLRSSICTFHYNVLTFQQYQMKQI